MCQRSGAYRSRSSEFLCEADAPVSDSHFRVSILMNESLLFDTGSYFTRPGRILTTDRPVLGESSTFGDVLSIEPIGRVEFYLLRDSRRADSFLYSHGSVTYCKIEILFIFHNYNSTTTKNHLQQHQTQNYCQ